MEAARPRQQPSPQPPGKRRTAQSHAPAAAPKLAELQALFQKAVIAGDPAILDLVADSSREDREVLFGVYRHAYRARLVEVLRNDYAELALVAGEDEFERLALKYVDAHPSRTPNARWYGDGLAEFLRTDAGHARHPERYDLAQLIRALNDAFDAADGTRLTLGDLAAVPPGLWGGLVFSPHPSLRRINHLTNAADLWAWARDPDATARPAVERLDEPVRIAVYRPELTPRLRRLGYEEAMMLDEMMKGVPFAGLCELVGTYGGEDGAALRAATHLKVWIAEGMLSGPETD